MQKKIRKKRLMMVMFKVGFKISIIRKMKYIEVGLTYRLILASEVVNMSVHGDVKVTKKGLEDL